MKRSLNFYVASIVIGAGLLFGALLLWQHISEPWWVIVIWAMSGWLSDLYPVEMRKINGNTMLLGLGMTFNLSAAVLFSPATAVIVGLIAGAPALKPPKWYKALFNAAQISISTAVASIIYHLIYPMGSHEIIKVLVVALALASYALVNNILVSGAIGFASGRKFLGILKDVIIDFFGVSIFVALAIAYIIIYLYPYIGLWVIPIALGPLLVIRFVIDLYKKFLNSKVESMYALLKALEEKDPYTAGHGERVALYTEIIAARLGIDGKRLDDLKIAAQLHDVGKIGVRDKILNKPGRLDVGEFEEIKMHPLKGAEILGEVPSFKRIIPWVKYHHEHWDGSGYPMGIKGKKIPLEARIIGISDAYDALTTKRAYRDAFTPQKALEMIKNESGKAFDPVVVAAFLDVIEEINEVRIENSPKYNEVKG